MFRRACSLVFVAALAIGCAGPQPRVTEERAPKVLAAGDSLDEAPAESVPVVRPTATCVPMSDSDKHVFGAQRSEGRTALIEGRVVDDGGKRVIGALVSQRAWPNSWLRAESNPVNWVRTDSNGRFRIAVPEGSIGLDVLTSSGLQMLDNTFTTVADHVTPDVVIIVPRVALASAPQTNSPLALAVPVQQPKAATTTPVQLIRVHGRCVDEEGKAIAGARIDANVTCVASVGSGIEPRTTEDVVMTNDDGSFRFDVPRLESDTKLYVALYANAGTAGTTRSSQGRAPADVVELSTLVCVSDEPTVIIEGTVVDDFGVPCAHCRVVEMTNVTNGEPKRRRPDNGAVTDEAGRFRIATFPGSFGFTASGPDGRFTLVGEDVEARRGDHVTGVVITLPAPRGPTSISGRVVDAQHMPVADARVIYDFREFPFGGSDTKSERDGGFRIDAWKLSTVWVWAIDPRTGSFSEARVLPTGLHDLEFVLDSKSTVVVNIVDVTGGPAPEIEWELHPEDPRVPPSQGSTTLANGAFICPTYPGEFVRLVVRSRITGAHAEWTGWTAGESFTLTLTR